MTLTSKVVTLVAASMMIAQVVRPELRKIVAEKSSDTYNWSVIEIWQKKNAVDSLISSAKFKKTTNVKATQFNNPADTNLKYLFFDTTQGDVEVRFYWTADAYSAIPKGAPTVPVFKNAQPYTQSDLPFGTTIKINCAPAHSGIGNCTMTPQVPAVKFNRVEVVKTDPGTQTIDWIVKSSSVKLPPNKSQTYGTVTIKKATGLTNKLKVPNNKPFWIIVSSNDKNDKVLHDPQVSDQIDAGQIKSNSIIDIDGQGKATLRSSASK